MNNLKNIYFYQIKNMFDKLLYTYRDIKTDYKSKNLYLYTSVNFDFFTLYYKKEKILYLKYNFKEGKYICNIKKEFAEKTKEKIKKYLFKNLNIFENNTLFIEF